MGQTVELLRAPPSLAEGNSIYLDSEGDRLLIKAPYPYKGHLPERRGQTSLERHECGRREAVWHFGVGSDPIECTTVVGPAAIAEFLVRRRRMPESNLKTRAIGAGPNHRRALDGIRAHDEIKIEAAFKAARLWPLAHDIRRAASVATSWAALKAASIFIFVGGLESHRVLDGGSARLPPTVVLNSRERAL